MTQIALPDAPRYDGSDYLPWRDDERLTGQMRRVVAALMLSRDMGRTADDDWWTLRQLHELTGDPEASISAQMRHLRKDRFGRHTIEKRLIGDGLYEYRLIPNPDALRIMANAPKRPSRAQATRSPSSAAPSGEGVVD